MSEATHTVARSMGEAAAAAARLIEKSVDHAVTELQSAEVQANADQRPQFAEAWRELLARRRAWGERFPKLLQAEFEAETRAGNGDAAAAGVAAVPADFLSMTLVDEDEIAHKIECSRLAQQLTSMLERPLSELDALMSSALGFTAIRPERNPLRPVVYARVLRNLMGEEQTEPALPTLWMRHMVKPLAQELEQVYRAQAELLTQAQVLAADYRVVTTPSKSVPRAAKPAASPAPAAPANRSAPAQAPAAAAAPASVAPHPVVPPAAPKDAPPAERTAAPEAAPSPAPAPAPTTAPSTATQPPASAPAPIDDPRLREFLASDAADTHEPVDDSLRAQLVAELRALEQRSDKASYEPQAAREHMHLPPVERPPRYVDTDSPLPQEMWGEYSDAHARSLVRGRLKTQARELGQVLGLELVHRLLDTIAEDPRLLGPVREAIVALEPSLARLAMVAPRFFSDEMHPGRLLVERIAERSFKYNDEFSVEFQAFLHPVAQTITRLNEIERLDNAIPFQAALATLQAGWRAQDALDEEAQRKVLETVQYAERRHQEAERIAARLRERDDIADAPPVMQDFVLRIWAVVAAQARLAQPSAGEDPGGHLALVPDLLWSVNPALSLRDPARAFVLIPRLLLKLREGLASLGQEPAESEAFFNALELLHRPVLKLRARQRHRELAPPEPPKVDTAAAPPVLPPDQPWMPARERDAAGFEHSASAGTEAAAGDGAEAPPPLTQQEAEAAIAAMEPGCWVDIFSHRHWRRAQLAWAADKGKLFMFVSHGGQPHSMTRRILERMVRERLLRMVAGDGVVPRALERLAQPGPAAPA